MDELLRTGQVARSLGVSESYVRRMIAEGRIPAQRTVLGNLIHRSDAEAFRRLRDEARQQAADRAAAQDKDAVPAAA